VWRWIVEVDERQEETRSIMAVMEEEEEGETGNVSIQRL
jgi:hypothetical protein